MCHGYWFLFSDYSGVPNPEQYMDISQLPGPSYAEGQNPSFMNQLDFGLNQFSND